MLKRMLGLSLTLAAAMGGLHFAALSGKPAPSGDQNSPNALHSQHDQPAPAAPEPEYAGGCTAYLPEKPHAYPYDENRGAADRVLNSFFGAGTPAMDQVRFAVALAPDPRHTNLSLMFDR